MTTTKIQFFWQDRSVDKDFHSGVSLHSHTMHSEESLEMIPRYTAKVPYLGAAIRRQEAEYQHQKGDRLDFRCAYWTPPLSPRAAHRLEEKQIESQFQLPGFVSLTDHDSIVAGMHLQVLERFRDAPVSTEWTIPFGATFFHLGVHNLPVESSAALAAEMAAFTSNPQPETLGPMLAALNDYRDVLLVLNHPYWDEKGVGATEHASALERLVSQHGSKFHALELNGLRSWNENKQVIALANAIHLPVVSGGDRHGCEPNAILNLSRGTTLVEFIHDLRYFGFSHVVLMPQYHEPLKLRILQTMVDIVREYPADFGAQRAPRAGVPAVLSLPEGRRRWSDRVFYKGPDYPEALPLSKVWKDGGPAVVRHFLSAMRLIELRSVRSALRLALDDRSTVWSDQEAAV
ncbi:MAG TPA: hypothetical protein VHZ07_15490 [Bryobacteraceae bacterium]|jgi:hypothetical protein|nr:hypothetical protein [Bryobacteraceae bacterium]